MDAALLARLLARGVLTRGYTGSTTSMPLNPRSIQSSSMWQIKDGARVGAWGCGDPTRRLATGGVAHPPAPPLLNAFKPDGPLGRIWTFGLGIRFKIAFSARSQGVAWEMRHPFD